MKLLGLLACLFMSFIALNKAAFANQATEKLINFIDKHNSCNDDNDCKSMAVGYPCSNTKFIIFSNKTPLAELNKMVLNYKKSFPAQDIACQEMMPVIAPVCLTHSVMKESFSHYNAPTYSESSKCGVSEMSDLILSSKPIPEPESVNEPDNLQPIDLNEDVVSPE